MHCHAKAKSIVIFSLSLKSVRLLGSDGQTAVRVHSKGGMEKEKRIGKAGKSVPEKAKIRIEPVRRKEASDPNQDEGD